MPSVNFLPFLQNIPFMTRILTGVLVALSSGGILYTSYIDGYTRIRAPGVDEAWLVLVPGKSYWYPWTLLTSGFVEPTIIELIVSIITLPLACRYLERIWGPYELLRFCIVTIVGSNIIAFGFSWLVFIVTRSQEALYGLPYHGLTALQVGFLVAFTQLIPEHQLQVFGVLKMRVKNLPGIYLLVSNVLVVLLGPSPYILIQFGFFVAWVYLRFFKMSEDGTIRGDRSETFAFQYWFPPLIRPYIAKAGNFVFKLAVRARLIQAWDEPQSGGYTALPGPGGARAEAERRRAMALKALDARLASTSPAPNAAAAVPAAASSSSAAPAVNASGPLSAGASLAPASIPPALKQTTSTRSIKDDTESKTEKERE